MLFRGLSSAIAAAAVVAFVSLAAGQTPKAILIGIDGMRPDALQRAMDRGLVPNLQALMENGTYCPNATTSDLTFSGPSWTDILAGIHRDQHGVATNSTSGNIFSNSSQAAFPDLLAIVKQNQPALRTARWTSWAPLSDTRTPGGTDYNFFQNYTADGDQLITQDAVRFFGEDNADVSFFYFSDVDIAGHAAGFHPRITSYLAEMASTDALLGQLLQAIRSRPGYVSGAEDWLFVVCTDHGGNLSRGHSGNRPWDREVFLIISGDAVARQVLDHGAKNVDIVPTILQHMGIAQAAHLVGHPIGFDTGPVPPVALDTNLIFNGDAEYDRGFPNASFDQAIAGWQEFEDADFILESSTRLGSNSGTVIGYGSNNYPTVTSPGAAAGGQNFFAGGINTQTTSMVQRVDVSLLAELIDSDQAWFQMTADLGGRDALKDRCEFAVEFFDENDIALGRASVKPVTAAERSNVTGFVRRDESGVLPAGTASVKLILNTQGQHGYADNLSFVISEAEACPEVVAFDTFDGLLLKRFDQVGGIGDGTDFTQHIPGWEIDNSGMSSDSLELAYNGVSAMDVDSWIAQQGVQLGRGSVGNFGVGTRNTALIFDADAWADFSGGENNGFNSAIQRTYDLGGADLNSLVIEFDWEFASYSSQRAIVDVSFDGGQNWRTLLDLDSDVLGDDEVSGGASAFFSGIDFNPSGKAMILRFAKRDAGNDWWFAVDNVSIADREGWIEVEDFEGLAMQDFTAANAAAPGDGTDYTNVIPQWIVDNRQMLGTSSEGAYQGWTAMDVQSWVEEQGGQNRSTLNTTAENIALVADPDAWQDYTNNAPANGFNSYIYREFDLRGFDPQTLMISFDWEFRVEGQQRGTVEISFDGGTSYEMLLDIDSGSGSFADGALLNGPSMFFANMDFFQSGTRPILRFGCTEAGNNWWFAVDNVMLEAVPSTCVLGDANGDRLLNNLDIEAFVLALLDLPAYLETYPNIDPARTLDFSHDGRFDNLDIDGFLDALLGR